jgi:hypothetical protein
MNEGITTGHMSEDRNGAFATPISRHLRRRPPLSGCGAGAGRILRCSASESTTSDQRPQAARSQQDRPASSPDERELDPADLIRKAEDSGLAVQSVRYTDFFMGPVASVLPQVPGGVVSLLGVLDALLLSVPSVNVLSAGVGVIMRRI